MAQWDRLAQVFQQSLAMFEVIENFITEDQANLIKAVEVREYGFRASKLKRAPKQGFYRGEQVAYSWGQHSSETEREEPFPEWMQAIAEKLGEPVNHAIVIRYSHGTETHAPWHSDKCEELGRKTGCMQRGTGFYNISVGDPRTFQMGDEGNVIWESKLPHCSMLYISAENNARYKHCVPKDKDWSGERWSLIFRTIVTKKRKRTQTPRCSSTSVRLAESAIGKVY
jgi:alkylated DNA repair dioxygenase AlkB